MLVAYLHFAANLSDSAPAPIEAWSLRAVTVLAKISRLLMQSNLLCSFCAVSFFNHISAISTGVRLSTELSSSEVISALAVSSAVITFTPVSMAARRITKPSC